MQLSIRTATPQRDVGRADPARIRGRIAILAVGALLVTACSASTPSQSAVPSPTGVSAIDFNGEAMTINTGGGTSEEVFTKYVITPFEQKYHAKINKVLGLTGDVVAKVTAERNNPTFDVIYLGETGVTTLVNQGLLDKLDSSKIPNLGELVPGAVPAGSFYVNFHFFANSIAYNTDKIKTPPTSYLDLFKPEYKGHVFISSVGSCCGLPFLLELNNMAGGDYKKSVDAGFAKLKELKPNLLTVLSSQDQGAQLLNAGDAWIGQYVSDRTGQQIKAGAHIGIAYPSTPLMLLGDSFAIVKGTKHKALAEAFINFALSAGPQGEWGSAALNFPANKNSTLTDEARKLLLSPKDVEKALQVDMAYFAEHRAEWLDRWNREVVGP